MAFTLDTETQKITFGVVADGTNDAISLPLADQFGATEDFNDNFSITPNFQDDFNTSSNWTLINNTISGGALNWTAVWDNVNYEAYHDLGMGNVSDTWILRFKIRASTLNEDNFLYCGLSDNTSDWTTTQDFIGMALKYHTATKDFGAIDMDNSSDSTTFDGNIGVTPITATDYYVEVTRLSLTSYQLRVFSDSNYSVQIGSTVTGTSPSTVTGLRYIKFLSRKTTGGPGGTCTGTIDNVEFYNLLQWTSTDETGDSSARIHNNVLQFSEITPDGTNVSIVHDLGTPSSDTKWLLRAKLTFTQQATRTVNDARMNIGLFDEDQNSSGRNNQDGIYFTFGASNVAQNYFITTGDTETGGAQPPSGQSNGLFTKKWGLETLYLELKRTSATTYTGRLYSDPSYTALIEEQSGTMTSSLNNLRYIKIQNDGDPATDATSTIVCEIDDLQFWDGIDTPVIRSNNWRMRFKLDFTNLNDGGSSTDTSLLIGLSDEDATSGSGNSQDGFFFITFIDTATDFYYIVTPNGQGPILISPDNTFTIGPSVGTTHYVEMLRESSMNGTINVYSDAGFTTLLQSRAITGLGGTENLRYLKLMNDETTVVSGSEIDGTFDDFSFVDLSDTTGTNTEPFTTDAILTSTITIHNKNFTIDGLPFAPPAILYLVDARLTTADFGLYRDIGDLIIRVLVENPSGLTGDEITDKIREITEVELEWGFLGKKHRVKGWLNKLFKDGVVQNDGSDPDWWQTVWTLV